MPSPASRLRPEGERMPVRSPSNGMKTAVESRYPIHGIEAA